MAKRRNGLWTQVILNTAGGHFVHTQNIPPFNAPPEVLIWGARVFTWKATTDGVEVYEEAWAYALVHHPAVPLPEAAGDLHSPENVVDIPGDVAPTYLKLSPENEMRAAYTGGPNVAALARELQPGEPYLATFTPSDVMLGEMPLDNTNAAQAGDAVADEVAAGLAQARAAEAACDPVDTPETWGDSPENGETTPDPTLTHLPGVPYAVRWAPPVEDVPYPVRPGQPPGGFSEGPPQAYEPISTMGRQGLTFHGPVGYEPMVHGDPDLKADDMVRVSLPQPGEPWVPGKMRQRLGGVTCEDAERGLWLAAQAARGTLDTPVTTTYGPEALPGGTPRGLTEWEARVLAMAYAARKHHGPKPLPWPFQCMEDLIAWCDQHGLPYPEGTYTTIPPEHYSNREAHE